MSAEAGEAIDSKFEIGHVLFLDIVGYSKLLIEEQKERLNQLTKIVLATKPVREASDEQLVKLPTGDGMALVFRHRRASAESTLDRRVRRPSAARNRPAPTREKKDLRPTRASEARKAKSRFD